MEKTCKRLSWVVLFSVVVTLVAVCFGIAASVELGKGLSESDQLWKYVLLAIVLIAGLVALITGIITFFSTRKGHVKNTIVAIGRSSGVQGIGPLAAFILAMIGCGSMGEKVGDVGGYIVFIAVSYIAVLFVQSLAVRGLKAFRKDKENYSYITVVSFLSSLFLVVFAVATMLTMFKVSKMGDTKFVGFIQTFAILFIAADIIVYGTLAYLAWRASKEAPKVTMADADASKLDEMIQGINDIKENKTSSMDNVTQLREYKKLLDEGIITKEEFEAKKKELL